MNDQKKDDSNETAWPITCSRYVAYIDIMGFKDMVARTSHNDIYNMMKKIENSKTKHENILWGNVSSKLVTTTTYSDSIMIYSKDESNDSLHSLICTVAGLTYDLFIAGIPHKGSIAFGLMTLDKENSIFFGQPLIDAYRLQEELLFYGIIIHASAELNMINNKYDMIFIIDYLCPLKNGSPNHLTVCPIFIAPPIDPQWQKHIEALFDSIKKLRYRTSGHLRKYIDNTELYLNSIKDIKV